MSKVSCKWTHVVDRPGRHIGILVLVISYKSVVEVVVGDQSMQACHCHEDKTGSYELAIIPQGVTKD